MVSFHLRLGLLSVLCHSGPPTKTLHTPTVSPKRVSVLVYLTLLHFVILLEFGWNEKCDDFSSHPLFHPTWVRIYSQLSPQTPPPVDYKSRLLRFWTFPSPEIKKSSEQRDRFCGPVVRVSGCSPRGPGFDSRRYQIFWVAVGLELGPLSLVRINEELLEKKKYRLRSTKLRLTTVGIHRAYHATPLCPQKLTVSFADRWRSLSRSSSFAD
jgi:hypothetical protein